MMASSTEEATYFLRFVVFFLATVFFAFLATVLRFGAAFFFLTAMMKWGNKNKLPEV
jgi:hypothetical protein